MTSAPSQTSVSVHEVPASNWLFNTLTQGSQTEAVSSRKVKESQQAKLITTAVGTGENLNRGRLLGGVIGAMMAAMHRTITIVSRKGTRNRRRLNANQTG